MLPTLRSLALATALLLPAATQAQQKLKYPKPQPDQIYDAVAQPAVPVGGLEAYAQYLADHQQYPTEALQRGAAGTVTVTFVVEKSGAVSNAVVAAPLDPALDQEALRLLRAGPRWTPAQHKGAKVRQRVTVPITFRIPAGSAEGGLASAVAPALPGTASGPTTVKADRPARPVGGEEAFFAWIQTNQRYPALARQRKVEGRVMVEFLVQPDGSLTDAKVLKPLGSGLDQEALRLLRAAPKWAPALYQGQPVKQKMVLPVVFTL